MSWLKLVDYSTVAVVAALVVAAFIVFRWVVLWYWKIDEAAADLKRIADALERVSSKSDERP